MLPQTVSLFEAMWIVIGSVGLIFGFRRLGRLRRRKRALTADGINGGDMLVANTWLGIQYFLMWIYSVVFVGGMISAAIPPVTPRQTNQSGITIGGILVIWTLLSIVGAVNVLQFYLDNRDRRIEFYTRRLRQILRRENAPQTSPDAPGRAELAERYPETY